VAAAGPDRCTLADDLTIKGITQVRGQRRDPDHDRGRALERQEPAEAAAQAAAG